MKNKREILLFSDIHFGKRQNSIEFNKTALEVVDKFIAECKVRKITTGIFCGDWHENRIVLNVSTLHYSTLALKRLDEFFKMVGGILYFLLGNHDLYYRNRRDVHSLSFLTNQFDNIHLIENPEEIKLYDTECLFIPWLVESDKIEDIIFKSKAKLNIGHYEFAKMKWSMNNPTLTEGISQTIVKQFNLTISGHYHTHQSSNNIVYVGSPMQMNFGDCGEDRGFLLLDIDTLNWEHIVNNFSPIYYKCKLSDILNNLTKLKNNHIKILEDIELKFESYSKLQKVILAADSASLVFDRYISKEEEEEANTDLSNLQSVEELLLSLIETNVEGQRKDSLLKLLREHL